jgi:hypothetical protein
MYLSLHLHKTVSLARKKSGFYKESCGKTGRIPVRNRVFLLFSDKYRCQHPKQLLAALTIFAGW